MLILEGATGLWVTSRARKGLQKQGRVSVCTLKDLARSGKVILKEGAGGPQSTGIHLVLRGTGSL